MSVNGGYVYILDVPLSEKVQGDMRAGVDKLSLFAFISYHCSNRIGTELPVSD